MNYDLAMMALEGLAHSPISVRATGADVTIEASTASFKELARLCLLLGGVQTDAEEFELRPGVHVAKDSPVLRLKVRG